MNKLPNRREFLKGAAALGAAVGLPFGTGSAAVHSVKRFGGAHLKTALNAFSFFELLTANAKDPSRGLELFQLCEFCAKHDFEGVDLTGYFFPGYPGVPADNYVFALKRRAYDLGLGISGTGVRNDFTTADKAVRAEGVRRVQAWVEVAAKLGAPVLRVFADSQPPHKNWQEASGHAARGDVEEWIAQAVRECAEHAKKFGVIIGVQNHADFVSTGAQHLSLLERVGSEWCGAIVDTGKYLSADPYADIAFMAPYAVNWQIKETPYGSADKPRTDLKKLFTIIRQSGYRGYVPIETLAMGRKDYDPYDLVPKFLAQVREAMEATLPKRGAGWSATSGDTKS
jgi:sugar phosphate isomerase/epimerase